MNIIKMCQKAVVKSKNCKRAQQQNRGDIELISGLALVNLKKVYIEIK